MTLAGTYTALVTPFTSDGSLDLDALAKLCEWQIASGIDGLVPCGSTGEAATLSHEEHVRVVRHVVEVARKRVPVIAGSGSNSTREAIELTSAARSAGADAALLISPYYNKPTQEGIFQHYRAVAQESRLPILAYNIPGRTASRLESETIARMSRVPGIAGLKECGADLIATSETLAQVAPGFAVLCGDDALTLPLLEIGARGAISTVSNIAPAAAAELVRAHGSGDHARARKLHYELLPVTQSLFIESNPIPVKTALAILGRIPNPTLRLPLTEISKANRERLEAALAELPRA
ncbi:MAG TPA: 4-hydroxy-tetrahydrodipicolinate synthase [Myxococcota bacterium]|nr:4-hydroxy-tetrahydrodipicolinate synthase [Myxococcota bacterium]